MGKIPTWLLISCCFIFCMHLPQSSAQMADDAAATVQLHVQGLNSPPVLANGISTTYVPILVKDEVGDLLLGGAAINGSATLGEVLDAWSAGPGVYLIRYRPPPVQLPETALLHLTVEQGNRRGEGTIEVPLVPAGRGSIEVHAKPSPLILGQDQNSQLTFIARDLQGQPISSSTLAIRAALGTIDGVSAMGNGRFMAQYTPPEGNFPRVDLITAVDTHLPNEVYGFFVLPLVGATRFPVRTDPGVSLEFEIGEQVFGPFITDEAGIANVEILVTPGVTIATATRTDTQGETKTEQLDLSAPPSQHLTMITPPLGVAADGQTPVPIRILVVESTGEPRSGAPLRLMADDGSLSPVMEQGAGLYESLYTPPMRDEKGEITITAYLEGEGEIQVTDAQLELLPAADMPNRPQAETSQAPQYSAIDWLSLNLSDTQIPADTPHQIEVRVQGYGTSGLPVTLKEDLVLVASVGDFVSQSFEEDGSLKALLDLPALAGGSSIAVVAADPVEGKSTWNLIYAGENSSSAWTPTTPPPTTNTPPDPEGDPEPEPASESAQNGNGGLGSNVLPPPPPALRTIGTRITPYYTAGYYEIFQTPGEDPGQLARADWGIKSPTYLGLGLNVNHWFGTTWGLAARGMLARYSFDSQDVLTEPGWITAFRTHGHVDMRFRHLLDLDGRGLALGARVGLGRQTYPVFTQADAESKPAFHWNQGMPLARAGLDAELYLNKPIEVHASFDLGWDLRNPDLIGSPNTIHGALGFEYYMTSSLSVGLSGDRWQRTIHTVEENKETPSATLVDGWTRGILSLSVHL